MKKLRKWLHLLLVICLIAGSILPYLPAMKLTVSAQETDGSGSGERTTTTVNKFYVDGVGSDDANGLTKDTAFKTLAEAYALIGEDNEKTYIVICGTVDASNSGLISYSTIEGESYKNYLMFPVHSGEVVITSEIGNEDYTQNASLSFGSGNDKIYMLQGATTFENINISSHAYSMYANFHNLTLGDGITGNSTYYPAQTVYLGFRRAKSGLSYNNDNSKASAFVMDSGKLQKFYAGTHSWTSTYSNMSVTMNGGVINTLYGTGIANSGVQSKVEITINGGNVNKCYGVCNQANVGDKGVTITIKKDATVGTVSAVEPANTDKNYVAKLNGPATLNLVGYDLSTAIPGTISDFDYLGLTNSTVQLAATWDGMTGVNMTDDSSLTLGAVPAADFSVKVQRSGESWITGTALVTAPIGADSKITLAVAEESEFVGYEFQCESGTENVTWTINSANAGGGSGSGDGTGSEGSGGEGSGGEGSGGESTNPAGNIFYVDGVGSDDANGLTKDTAFKTLAEAYTAIQAKQADSSGSAETYYIVICGNVDASNSGLISYLTIENADKYKNTLMFPAHSGEVVLTSKIGAEDYTQAASLSFGSGKDKQYMLQGATTFENINISSYAKELYAGFYNLTLGDGITGDSNLSYYPVQTVYLGFKRVKAGLSYNNDNNKASAFVMNSGKLQKFYAGTCSWNSTYSNMSVTVNGGVIDTLYGTSNINSSVQSKVEITINGGNVNKCYGVCNQANVGDKGVTITIKKDATVGTVSAVEPANTDKNYVAKLNGPATLNLVGYDLSTAIPGTISDFDYLGLTNSTVQLAATWDGMTGVKMTDNSLLKFEFVPTEKMEVVAFKSGDEWQTTNPLIQAPSSTEADIFNLMDPMDYKLACTGDANGAYWTMEKAPISIGEPGTSGTALNLDLGLPNGTFTPIDADADAYEVYQQKVADLGEAATEVKVIEPVTVQGEVELHVSPQGNDDNNGSMAAPFKTITKALSYVEALENLDVKGIVIYLHEGIYVASDSIVLNEKHSGTNGIPVIISAYGDDEVVVTGGTDIAGTSFAKVTDETVLNRLQDSVKDRVMVVDLKELGISEFGSIDSGRYGGPNYSVEMNGERLTLARYPDATNLPLGEVLDPGPVTDGAGKYPVGAHKDSTGTEFVMQDLRPTMWENDGNIWLYGNLAVDWTKEHSRVAEIRTATPSIKLGGGVTYGAYNHKNHTYYYYNVLEELNVPGEFYLDHSTGKLYIYPIGDMSTATVSFTANANDLFSISGASNVVLNGLTIENSGGTGINVSSGSQNILVQNCVIRKVDTGAKVYGKNSGIIYSEIYEINERPVQIGYPYNEHKYDEPDHNFVQNCYVYSTGMVGFSNTPIYVQGVQNVVSHNLIQGTYAVSIYLLAAAECIVEYNEIVGGPDGTYDYGSIYAAPSGGQTGNHIRYNYIHDTARFSKQGNPHSIYLDEGARGNFVYGNVMTNVQNGVYLHFGSDNVVVDNVVMSFREGRREDGIFCNEKMADLTIAERWERSSTPKKMYEVWASYSEADKLVFKQRYPGYADLYEKVAAAIAAAGGSTDTGVGLYMAEGNYAKNNILVGFGGVDFAGREHVVIDNDVFTEDPFVDAANHDYALKSGVETSFTYAPLNMSRVGVLCEKKGIEAFSLYAPAAAFEEVDPFNVLLKWTLAGGADTYRVTIASNEALTENIKEFTVEDTCLYMDRDEYFGFGQTCYWKVTANTTAESRVATPVSSAVSSFKTMTEDIYYQYNSADLTELTEVIQEANTLDAQMTEISAGGLYYDGGKESLQAAISTAQAVVDAGVRQEQTDVNAAVSALESAILAAMASKAVTYVTFEELDASEWSDRSAARGQAAVSGDELQLSFQTGNRTEVVYDKLIGSREILCFEFALDQQNNWHGFAIGQSDRSKFITNSTGYFVCFSGDEIQLQKYIDGVKVTGADLLKITNTGEDKMFASGQTYSIQLGALQNADGSVRILFKVDGNVIIDYLDTENPVIGDNGFGVVIQKLATNGVAHLKLADLTEAEKADYTALETELAKEETLTEGDYTEESWAAYKALVQAAENLTNELTDMDQDVVDEMVADLKAAREALVKASSATPTPPPQLEILEGTATSFTQGTDGTASIHCSGELQDFVKVDVDGQTVDEANYTLEEGSTILTFKNAYLSTLTDGEHTVTLHYTGNRSIESKLTITAANTDSSDTDSNDNDEVEEPAATQVPAMTEASDTNTGDSSNLLLWMLLLAATSGVCSYLVAKKKKVES